jgi:hypothetical protein
LKKVGKCSKYYREVLSEHIYQSTHGTYGRHGELLNVTSECHQTREKAMTRDIKHINVQDTIRELTLTELDQVAGGGGGYSKVEEHKHHHHHHKKEEKKPEYPEYMKM